jgi:riboflavin biosynthesis pyrimidine reductase
MQLIYPAPEEAPEVEGTELVRLYAYPDGLTRPWLRANMVTSVDGAATLGGRSGGLSGEADRLVFNLLRALADVILVGAGTVRAEGYGPAHPHHAARYWPALRAGRSRVPPIAVVTRRLDLDLAGPLVSEAPPDARTIVITTRAAPPGRLAAAAAAGADVVVAGEEAVDLRVAVRMLAERGRLRVLAEGGPRLLGEIAGAGLLDELCLTVSPLLAGGRAGRILDAAGAAAAGPAGAVLAGARPHGAPGSPGSLGSLVLGHVLADGSHLLCRYLRAGRAGQASASS